MQRTTSWFFQVISLLAAAAGWEAWRGRGDGLRSRPVVAYGMAAISLARLLRAASLLAQKGISGVPVIDGARLVGVFSESDILRSLSTVKKDIRMVYPSISPLGIAFQEEVTQREIIEAYDEIGHRPVKERRLHPRSINKQKLNRSESRFQASIAETTRKTNHQNRSRRTQ